MRAFYVGWIMVEVFVLVAFMSVFFTSRKTSFISWLDTSSTPPRYLIICRASKPFSYRNLDTSSTPGGSIEIFSVSSIPSRHLVDRSSFSISSAVWYLDTFSIPQLSKAYFLDTYLDRTSIPLDTSAVEIY